MECVSILYTCGFDLCAKSPDRGSVSFDVEKMGRRRSGCVSGGRTGVVFSGAGAAIPPPLPVFLLGCTVQCLRRRIDRVLLAGGGREAESRPGSYEPLLVDMTGVVQ